MATIAEKLQQAIANQQAEVDRLRNVVKTDLPSAEARLAELQGIAEQVTPGIEKAFALLRKVGVSLDTER